MILVDTSAWRLAARRSRPVEVTEAARWDEAQALPGILDGAQVAGHLWVYAELLLGGLPSDAAARYRSLPGCRPLGVRQLVEFVERVRPRGVGLVDMALLGAAVRDGFRLWTLDAGLRKCAEDAGARFTPGTGT